MRTTPHVLGLELCVLDLGLGGLAVGLRGKALGVDPFSRVCLVFFMLTDMVT